jgi:hypothetical protein
MLFTTDIPVGVKLVYLNVLRIGKLPNHWVLVSCYFKFKQWLVVVKYVYFFEKYKFQVLKNDVMK